MLTKKQLAIMDFIKTGKIIKELGLLYEEGISSHTPSEISGSLKGRKNLYNHLESMLKKAKKSVILTTNTERFNEKSESFSSRKTIDINNLDLAPLTDILSPETAYFALCDNSKITVSLEGSDPGPFNKKLVAKGLTFIPTRNNMASKKLFEFVEGCSGFNFGKSSYCFQKRRR